MRGRDCGVAVAFDNLRFRTENNPAGADGNSRRWGDLLDAADQQCVMESSSGAAVCAISVALDVGAGSLRSDPDCRVGARQDALGLADLRGGGAGRLGIFVSEKSV